MATNTASGNQSAFTLVEILIVISIMSLLLTLVLPRYFNSVELSKKEVQTQNIRAMQSSIDQYYHDKGVYPSSLETLVETGYLKAIPVDPLTDTNTSWVPEYKMVNGNQGVADVKSGQPVQASNP
jgi:general secretion pathway protein G